MKGVQYAAFCFLTIMPALGMSCGTSLPSVPCINIDDVINIPAGDAVGNDDRGVYRAVSNVRTSCAQCELNTVPDSQCTVSSVDPSVRVTLTQDNGRLSFEGSDGSTGTGSINADGSFLVGIITTPTGNDGITKGQALGLFKGAFVGNRIIGTLTARLTINENDGRTTDLLFVQNITYERVE